MKPALKAEFADRLVTARLRSEYSKRVVLLMLARNVPTMTGKHTTLMPIQGGVIVDAVWERWRNEGVTFRTLAAFKNGKRIPIPTNLKRGYA